MNTPIVIKIEGYEITIREIDEHKKPSESDAIDKPFRVPGITYPVIPCSPTPNADGNWWDKPMCTWKHIDETITAENAVK